MKQKIREILKKYYFCGYQMGDDMAWKITQEILKAVVKGLKANIKEELKKELLASLPKKGEVRQTHWEMPYDKGYNQFQVVTKCHDLAIDECIKSIRGE